MKTCRTCSNDFEDDDLRPYGPGGSLICYPCGMAPERKAETEKNLGIQMEAAMAQSNIVIIGEPSGPRPLNPGSLV